MGYSKHELTAYAIQHTADEEYRVHTRHAGRAHAVALFWARNARNRRAYWLRQGDLFCAEIERLRAFRWVREARLIRLHGCGYGSANHV